MDTFLYLDELKFLKRLFKRNTHNLLFKIIAGFGRSMNRLYENRNHDIHSNGEAFLMSRVSQLNPVVIIDAGANVGNWAKMATVACQNARIYCFEPVLETHQKLTDIINGAKLENIEVVKSGLYKETTSLEINQYSSDEHSSIYDIQGVNYVKEISSNIHVLSGDEFLRRKTLDFVDVLKLDVEGAEMDALIGFEASLQNGKIRLIQFEYGYINITTKTLLIDFYRFFEKHGYIVGKLFPKRVNFRAYTYKHEDFIGPNFVAVRKSDIELINLIS